MEYNKQKYDKNEKLVLSIGLWLIAGSIVLFILSVLMIDNFESISEPFQVLATIGVIASAGMVITGNVRVARFLVVIRKADNQAFIWKSALVILLGLLSLFVFWFTMLVLVFQNL